MVYGKKGAETVRRKQKRLQLAGSVLAPALAAAAYFQGLAIESCAALLVFGLAGVWLVPALLTHQKALDARMGFKLELPDLLDAVALLLEAGQPVWTAVEKASAMTGSGLCSRVADALGSASGMEEGGNPERRLERLSSELKIPAFSSAVSAIVQNSRKGEQELASVLRMQSGICRQERKALAEEMGNRASNLMLIPSAIIFIALIIMLIVPAVMQLNII